MKNTLQKLKFIPLIGLLLFITTSTTVAHAPEEHIINDQCREEFLDQWHNESNDCDPNNPLTLLGGITHSQYPNGLCYPSFNNYTDAVDSDSGIGLDPFGFNPPIFADERNFFKAAKSINPGQGIPVENFADELTIDDGDIIQFFMYVHNDGDPCFNDNISIPSGKFYSAWNTTSHGTKINVEPNFTTANNSTQITINQPTTFNGSIWSNDAVNEFAVRGGKTQDSVRLVPANNKELRLELIPTSGRYIDMRDEPGFEWWFLSHTISDISSLLSNNGFELSTLHRGNIKGSGGDHYASEPYIGLVRFQLRVSEVQPPVCQNLTATLDPNTVDIFGDTGYHITANAQFSEGDLPAEAQFRWVSTDPNGRFFLRTATSFTTLRGGSDITTSLREVYYVGNGPVSVTLTGLPDEQANPTVCRAVIEIPQEQVPVCEELQVNRQNPIFTDRVSTFRSRSLDSNESIFNGKITYSVDAGYGSFYLAPPVGREASDAATVIEFSRPAVIIPPAGGFCEDQLLPVDLRIPNRLPGPSIINLPGADIIELNNQIVTGGFNNLRQIITPADRIELPRDLNPTGPTFRLETRHYGLASSINVDGLNPNSFFNSGTNGLNTDFSLNSGLNNSATLQINPALNDLLDRLEPQANPPFDISDGLIIDESITINPANGLNLPLPNNNPNPPRLPPGSLTLPEEPVPLNPFVDRPTLPLGLIGYQTITVDPGTTVYFVGTQPGNNVIHVDTNCTSASGCSRNFSVTQLPEEEQPVCTDLNQTVRELGSTTNVNQLEPNNIYTVSARATFQNPTNPTPVSSRLGEVLNAHLRTITLTTNINYGVFIDTTTPLPLAVEVLLRDMQRTNTLTFENLNGLFTNRLSTNITVNEGSEVVFVTFSNVPGSISNALTIQSTGSTVAACNVTVPLEVPITGRCVDLDLQPVGGNFNPARNTSFNITGNFRNHPGQIEVTTNVGRVSRVGDESNASQRLIFTQTEVARGSLSFLYLRDSNYDPATDDVELRVRAIGDSSLPAGSCEDSIIVRANEEAECVDLNITEPESPWRIDESDNDQRFRIDVDTSGNTDSEDLYYTWRTSEGQWRGTNDDEVTERGALSQRLEDFDEGTEVEVFASDSRGNPLRDSSGRQICFDSIRARGDERNENPEINKFVYPENELEDLDDIINISDRTDHVTYMAIFNPGTSRSVEIRDEALSNGRIRGSIGGNLSFTGMEILVIDDNRNEDYVMLRSDKYEENDRTTSRYDDSEFDDNNNNDLEDFQDEYQCENSTRTLCLEEDFDQVLEDFSNGRVIRFQNIDTIGENGAIIIKYQLDNETEVDEETCRNLTAGRGCGEQFENTISFTAFEEEDFDGDEFDDEDRARVIVLCPFIISRGGGDTFFHDIIDTGIDVAQCSRVRNADSTSVTPTPERPRQTPGTGASDEPVDEEYRLLLPSHDICRYSNVSSNLEGYNDVLKNFSSTICELRADVAEDWKERNINEAIAANVTRIARWGDNLVTTTLTSIQSLANASNKQSGVFVSIGKNITIDAGTGSFKIEGVDGIPAAQTYIVKDANLIINSNIEYATTDFSNPNKIPSAAFIVIDGNIEIDADVERIDGILMAVDLDDSGDGQVVSKDNKTSDKILTINGNLIGNVNNLFSKRIGVGDPRKDEGKVTMLYDERILLNTPPGISELINVQQAIVP